MDKVKKTGILVITPWMYRPDLPYFKDRYSALSEVYDVHIIAPCDRKYDGLKLGNATFYTIPQFSGRFGVGALKTFRVLISRSMHIFKKHNINLIVAYDPLTLGLAAALLKKMFGARVIIEINGHLLTAGFLSGWSFKKVLKKIWFKTAINISLSSADAVKILNNQQRLEFKKYLENKAVFKFHDYVPTHIISKSINNKDYIFFAGFPFFLKGVDILIAAFKMVTDEFPHVKLIIMGHHTPKEEQETKLQIGNCRQIELMGPVHNDEILEYFKECLFFVLPSRSEAMGRVLIEAMSFGKPVIGSDVGGIPEIIEDGKNGFLFRSEDVDDLAAKLKVLISNPDLRMSMGEAAYDKAHSTLSSSQYISAFSTMISAVYKPLQPDSHSRSSDKR